MSVSNDISASAVPLDGGVAVDTPDPKRWLGLVLLALVQFMFALDTTIVNPALPTIQSDLHFSTANLAWVVNGYALMAGGFGIVAGRISDVYGRRRMFLIGAFIFGVGSALSGAAQSDGMLIAARFTQGLGTAIATPAALALVVLLFTNQQERAKAIGAWAAITGLGATLGVVISGFIVDYISWRWIFFVNIPVAVLVILGVPRIVKESRMPGEHQVDVPGATLVTAALTLVVYGLLNAAGRSWTSDSVLIPLVIGGVLLVAFIVWQALNSSPLIPKGFFSNRTRVSANGATIFVGAAFFTFFFILTLYMQDVLHYSALKTGLAWGPFGAMLFLGFGVAAKVLPKVGVKYGLAVAMLLSALGVFLITGIHPNSFYASHLLPGMLVMAFGQAVAFVGLQTAGLHGLGPSDAGIGGAVQNTSQQLGGSLGLAIIVTFALRHTSSELAHGVNIAVATTNGYVLALRLCAIVMAAGAGLTAFAFERMDFIAPEEATIETAEADAGVIGEDPNLSGFARFPAEPV